MLPDTSNQLPRLLIIRVRERTVHIMLSTASLQPHDKLHLRQSYSCSSSSSAPDEIVYFRQSIIFNDADVTWMFSRAGDETWRQPLSATRSRCTSGGRRTHPRERKREWESAASGSGPKRRLIYWSLRLAKQSTHVGAHASAQAHASGEIKHLMFDAKSQQQTVRNKYGSRSRWHPGFDKKKKRSSKQRSISESKGIN